MRDEQEEDFNDGEEKRLAELGSAYRSVFGSVEGTLVLKDLMEACLDGAEVCIPTKRDGSVDALWLAYSNGRQAIGAHIRNRMMRGKDE